MFSKFLSRPNNFAFMVGDVVTDILFVLKFYWITIILFGVVVYIPYTITANLFTFIFNLF